MSVSWVRIPPSPPCTESPAGMPGSQIGSRSCRELRLLAGSGVLQEHDQRKHREEHEAREAEEVVVRDGLSIDENHVRELEQRQALRLKERVTVRHEELRHTIDRGLHRWVVHRNAVCEIVIGRGLIAL